jgi:hypothetical protein
VRSALICTTRSRSPTSMPNSSVDVATITQSRASANAASAWRRSSTDNEACERKVVTPRSRSAVPSFSTSARLSQKTSRFSPRCSTASTVAALSIDPT